MFSIRYSHLYKYIIVGISNMYTHVHVLVKVTETSIQNRNHYLYWLYKYEFRTEIESATSNVPTDRRIYKKLFLAIQK